MALSNRERVRKGLDELVAGLAPFVERELKAKLGAYWVDDLTSRSKGIKREGDSVHWDTQAILKAMVDNWQGVFRYGGSVQTTTTASPISCERAES